jgi:hypothetical protein
LFIALLAAYGWTIFDRATPGKSDRDLESARSAPWR